MSYILKQIKTNKCSLKKSYFNHTNYDFFSEESKLLQDGIIQYAEFNLNRIQTEVDLAILLGNFEQAQIIENSIFESSLTYCLIHDYDVNLINATYEDKKYNIIKNMTDKNIGNKNFILNIKNNKINLKEIGFMNSAQLFPEKWNCFIKKKEAIEKRENNIKYSDAYKCYTCGESKCTVSLVQTRSADEPMTCFVTCLVCGTTRRN